MIGPLEIVIVVVVLALIFGYRRIPAAGRWTGTNLRELKDSVKGTFGDKADPKELARSAGKGVREARELRDELTGKGGGDESTDSTSRTESR
jgi:TatA/E family protein of Tat protein translocase